MSNNNFKHGVFEFLFTKNEYIELPYIIKIWKIHIYVPGNSI